MGESMIKDSDAERVAKRFCEILGDDPHELVPDPELAGAQCERWHTKVKAARQSLAMRFAILEEIGR
jgi:hypothetical protein